MFVEDNALLRRSLAFNLENAGYRVSTAATAEEALGLAQQDRPDLVLLDINLPGMDGLEALSHFRRAFDVPVIFLTGRRRELDEILGLRLGADDYITKPFNEDVLLAHIKAVLRRVRGSQAYEAERVLEVGDLEIDPRAHVATLAGERLELSPREFDLLHVLALEAGRAITVDDLLERVWGASYQGQPQVVYVHIRRLRAKLEKDPNQPKRLLTVRGGYTLQAEEV